MPLDARSRSQRIADVTHRLRHDVDCWVASADSAGAPYLVPLSFLWSGDELVISTATQSRTAKNLCASGVARLALGETRDVVMIDASVRIMDAEELTTGLGDDFADATGFDPRSLTSPYVYLALRPHRIQAWREENEIADRDVMVDSQWMASPAP